MTTLNSQGLLSVWYDGKERNDTTHRGHLFVASVEDFVRILHHFDWVQLAVWEERPFTEDSMIGWIRPCETGDYEWWVKS